MESSRHLKIERLLGLVLLLSTRGKLSCLEISEIFEVSIRQVYRDLESLNLAGVPIRTKPGPNGGVELEESYHQERGIFSRPELAQIVTTLSASISFGAELDTQRITKKVRALIPPSEQDEFNRRAESIFLDLSPWNRSTAREARLRMIEDAIHSSLSLDVVYLDSSTKETRRVIEPHTLILKGLSWYLYAWCTMRDGFRTFRVSRMKSIELTKTAFTRRDIDLSTTPWNDTWQRPDETVRVRIRFDEFARSHMSECFPEEEFIGDGDGWYTVEVTAPTPEWLCGFILSLGTHAVLLGPQEVREMIRATAHSILAFYSG